MGQDAGFGRTVDQRLRMPARINFAVKVLVERIEQIICLRGGHLPLSSEDVLEFCCGLSRALGCQATNGFEFN